MDFLKLYRALSGKKTPRLAIRTIIILLPTIILYGGMTAASIFASKVAINKDGGGIARAKNQGCGVIQLDVPVDDPETESVRKNKIINDTIAGRNYVSNFYADTDSGNSVRSPYITDSLPYTVDFNVACPVKNQSLCDRSASAVTFESGLLDSHEMFGINAKLSDRVQARASTTCALLNVSAAIGSDNNYYYYFYGPSYGFSGTQTFSYAKSRDYDRIGYQLRAVTDDRFSVDQYSTWTPIDGVTTKEKDGDLTLIFMSQNYMRCRTQVNDPFFKTGNFDKDQGMYQPFWATNAMLCVDRYMMCNPTNNKCLPYRKYENFFFSVLYDTSLGLNDVQHATAARLTVHMQQTSMVQLVSNMNAGALYASDHLSTNWVSSGLPANQWHLEVTGWFQTKLAMFQSSSAEYINKPRDSSRVQVLTPDDPSLKSEYKMNDGMIEALKDQCKDQLLMGSTDIESFSLAGALVIIVMSINLFIIAFFMKDIMNFFSRFIKGSKGMVARESDEKLHLLRLAMTASGGPSDWVLTKSIPVTSDCSSVKWHQNNVQLNPYLSAEQLVNSHPYQLPK